MKNSKEIKAGVIALVSIVGFVLMYQFTKGRSLFTSENIYHVKYTDVQGLVPSTRVSINGIKVGQVTEVKPVSNPKEGFYSIVTISVDDQFKFSENSTAEIYKPDIMGNHQIRINISYDGKMLKDGDFMKGATETSLINNLSSQVEPVKNQLESVLKRVDSLSNNANRLLDDKNRAEVKMLLANLNKVANSFDGLAQNTSSIIKSNDAKISSVLSNADKTMVSVNNAFDKYGQVASDLDVQKLNETIASLDYTVKNLNTVIGAINSGEGSLGKLINDEKLYQNLEQTTSNLNVLVDDIKKNPKKYINISVFGKK